MPVRLPVKPLEKVWGSPNTEPWYRNSEGKNIGEVWFVASDATPILVKFLFTSDNLSVQVHPGDDYARAHENGSPGKTEMWHVLRAERGAKLAVGLRKPETAERVREAAQTGEIVNMLHWVDASPGDTFFIPAGTIHAIGAGLALCEVQQLSDITYRLYDFGRGRELHLDKSLDVATLGPCDAKVTLPVECPYFRTERRIVEGSTILEPRLENYLLIVLSGEGTLSGEPFQTGEAWEINPADGPIPIQSPNATLLFAQPLLERKNTNHKLLLPNG